METKTNEPVKQEGEFKIKKKTTPKKLVETKDNVTKVNINSKEPLVEVPNNVTKVEIKKQEDFALKKAIFKFTDKTNDQLETQRS